MYSVIIYYYSYIIIYNYNNIQVISYDLKQPAAGWTEFCLEYVEEALKIIKSWGGSTGRGTTLKVLVKARQNFPGSEVQYYQQRYFLIFTTFKGLVLSTVYIHTGKM